jgi:hypothetical protein
MKGAAFLDTAGGPPGERDQVVGVVDVAIRVRRALALGDADPGPLVDSTDRVLDVSVIENDL